MSAGRFRHFLILLLRYFKNDNREGGAVYLETIIPIGGGGGMKIEFPKIIQGGMGVGVSNWRLAKTVSQLGQLGVVSGTALDVVLARRLQEGDPGGEVRRAMSHFTFPKIAQRIQDALFVPGGRKPGEPFKMIGMHAIKSKRWLDDLCMVSNFVEVYLAREGHSNPVGINYLEKIQLPHLPSIYGAMLAGVAVVIVGAGIPVEIPGVLDVLAMHQPASYPIRVQGAQAGTVSRTTFDPAVYLAEVPGLAPLYRPDFLPIVSSDALAAILVRKSNGSIQGFVVEGPLAGGHNAPPRGLLQLTPDGQPIYGSRDSADLAALRKLGLPFWLAGSCGSPEGLQAALAQGAAGIQVGTAFALCVESGLVPEIRRSLIAKSLAGDAHVFTDPAASPTGFPFKVVQLEGSLSEASVYQQRRRICDLGFLREAYRKEDGSVGYRCPAEPEASFLAKGGKPEELIGRKCVCNGLSANIGMAQLLPDGTYEQALVTLGDRFDDVGRFCTAENPDFTAADVIRHLLG
jgi:nitronate monooxygenase